jgi:SpoVK/Ycf46/Vps4 family AAA+-type ATPase
MIALLIFQFDSAINLFSMIGMLFFSINIIAISKQIKNPNYSFVSEIAKKAKGIYSLFFRKNELLSLIDQADKNLCELIKNIQLVNNFISDNENWQNTIFLNDSGVAVQFIAEEYNISPMGVILFCSFLKFYNNGCPVSSDQIKDYLCISGDALAVYDKQVFELRKMLLLLKEYDNPCSYSIPNEIFISLKAEKKYKPSAIKFPEELNGIIVYKNILNKDIYLNEQEKTAVDQIRSLLNNNTFQSVCERLREKKLRTGFACLFYGAPGTGKTETVYQLARETERDIIKIDISSIHDRCFGGMAENIKEAFDRYHDLSKNYLKAPILFFNEADGIFTKRLAVNNDVAHPAVIQDNNSVQNIILEALENFEGILIATTNMATNFDSAFERRFIFKVEFSKPNPTSREAIWRSFVPELKGESLKILSHQFQLSGGQIENIARKTTVQYAITGNEPTMQTLFSWCKEENMNKNEARIIGFNATEC